MNLPSLLIACALAAAAAWAGTGLLLKVLIRFEIYDDPCARSSHHRRKPTGGGFAVVAVAVAAWLGYVLWIGAWPGGLWTVLLGTAFLVVISGIDDVRNLPVAPRFLVQVVAVGLGLLGLDETELVFQGLLPLFLDRLAGAILWLWFVNLFNFMDGIDGISGVEAASIGVGLGLVAWLAGLAATLTVLPLLLAAAALGFLLWNWAPSKVFLGDVGSVPLGYLLGWLLLVAASQGQWAPALILPLYYLCDATLTLGRRALRGDTVWHVHREHLYQRAVQAGYGHAQVALMVLGGNSVLIALALLASTGHPWPALLGAGAFMAVGLLVLERRFKHDT